MFKPKQELPTFTFIAGSKPSVLLQGMQEGARAMSIGFEIEATVTSSAAGVVTVYPRQLARSIQLLSLESDLAKVRATGRMLWALYKKMKGKSLSNGGVSIPGGSSATLMAKVIIPFAHPRAANPADFAQDTDLIRKAKEIEIALAATNVIGSGGGGVQAISAATFRPFVTCIEGNGPDNISSELEIDFTTWSQQTAYIKGDAGICDLFNWDEDDDALTLTEYDHITLRADGREVLNNIKTSELVNDYNDLVAIGAAQDNELEQLPLSGNLLFLPIVTAPSGFKSTQLIDADDVFELIFTGTATSQRIGWYKAINTKETKAEEVLVKKGIDPSKVVPVARTLKGNSLQGTQKRVLTNLRRLPKRVVAK